MYEQMWHSGIVPPGAYGVAAGTSGRNEPLYEAVVWVPMSQIKVRMYGQGLYFGW